jgi:hypothetical protein
MHSVLTRQKRKVIPVIPKTDKNITVILSDSSETDPFPSTINNLPDDTSVTKPLTGE